MGTADHVLAYIKEQYAIEPEFLWAKSPMNKEHWITLVLDGSMPMEDIYPLIHMSLMAAAKKK